MSTVYLRFAVHKSDSPRRSPLLERLLVRAPRPVAIADWRADALRVLLPDIAQMPSIAAAAWQAAALSADQPESAIRHATGATAARGQCAWACIATPVHLSAGMSSVTMPRDGILTLESGEADALAADFNRVFAGDGVRVGLGRAGLLLCAFDDNVRVETHDPETAAGQDVFGFQPSGADAPRLRRLMSEIEMWLFDHAVNRARVAQAKLPVTGLWLWGGGPTAAPLPSSRGWTAGADPLFSAFGGVEEWPDRPGPGVVVCGAQPGSEAWADLERRWLAPAIGRLKSRRLSCLDLSAGGCRFSIGPGIFFPFWRRPRPWWESFGVIGEPPDGVDGEAHDVQ